MLRKVGGMNGVVQNRFHFRFAAVCTHWHGTILSLLLPLYLLDFLKKGSVLYESLNSVYTPLQFDNVANRVAHKPSLLFW
jgi:hypothetical protein